MTKTRSKKYAAQFSVDREFIMIAAVTVAVNSIVSLISWYYILFMEGAEGNPLIRATPADMFERIFVPTIIAVILMLLLPSRSYRRVTMGAVLGIAAGDLIHDVFLVTIGDLFMAILSAISVAALLPVIIAFREIDLLSRQIADSPRLDSSGEI